MPNPGALWVLIRRMNGSFPDVTGLRANYAGWSWYVSSLCGRITHVLQRNRDVLRSVRFLMIWEKLYCYEQSSGLNGKAAVLHKRCKILVVDDERAIASTLALILEGRGYETAEAYSGEEAIRVACIFQPDCIVSDVVMGAINGIDAAIEILRVRPCKVLFISGNAGYGNLLENARANGFDFEILLKPVAPLELLARISRILSNSDCQAKGRTA